MRHIAIFILLLVVLFLTGSCKKGKDDPAFSLLTRKARVTGNWTMTEGKSTLGIQDSTGSYGYIVCVFSNGTYTISNRSNGAVFDGSSSLLINFTRKGEFEMKQMLGASSLNAVGSWDFLGRVGDNKNKETISFRLNTLMGNSNLFELFNKANINFLYKIKELRAKKMVLSCTEENVLLDSGFGVFVTSEYTFTQ